MYRDLYKNLVSKYAGLSTVFKSFFILLILFFVFFGVNLFITIKNKPKSAYTILNEERPKMMLQDTRVHNWNELEKEKK